MIGRASHLLLLPLVGMLILAPDRRCDAQERVVSAGFTDGLPSSIRTFSFHELKKKILRATPPKQAVPAAPKTVFDHSIRMPVQPEQKSSAPPEGASVDHYVKVYAEYEDFKDLIEGLPKGVLAQDVALDLAQIRAFSLGLGTAQLKSSLRKLVRHTGKFSLANGALDVAKLGKVLLQFDIERTLRINRAILDLQKQMAEYARLVKASAFGPTASKQKVNQTTTAQVTMPPYPLTSP